MTLVRKLLPTAALATVLIIATSGCTKSDETGVSSDETNTSEFQPTRNAQGHPNMQGTWDFRTLTPLERPEELADKAVFSAEEEEAFRQKALYINDTDNK